MIYLDNCATTRVFDLAAEQAARFMLKDYCNSSAPYAAALDNEKSFNAFRREIAGSIGAQADEIYFTSGGTESDNTVIFGAADRQRKKIIISATEHPAVYEAVMHAKEYGAEVAVLPVDPEGRVRLKDLDEQLSPDCALVSIMHVNNETGVINPIGELAELTHRKAPGCIFHSDGVQAHMRIECDVKKLGITTSELRKMMKIGIPAGLQGMVFSVANIFVQSSINKFGSDAVAGSAAALNYEYYCYFIISAIAQAAVAFTSQNYGAGNLERCRRVFCYCMILSLIGCGIPNIIISWQNHFFLSIFTSDENVITLGTIRLQYVLMLQFLASSYEISSAAMRGYGYSMTPTVLTIFGTCVLRLVWIFTVLPQHWSLQTLFIVYPVSWVITGTIVIIAYYVVSKKVERCQSIRL